MNPAATDLEAILCSARVEDFGINGKLSAVARQIERYSKQSIRGKRCAGAQVDAASAHIIDPSITRLQQRLAVDRDDEDVKCSLSGRRLRIGMRLHPIGPMQRQRQGSGHNHQPKILFFTAVRSSRGMDANASALISASAKLGHSL